VCIQKNKNFSKLWTSISHSYIINIWFGISKLSIALIHYNCTKGGMFVMPLPNPEGRQKEVLCLPERGHYVVLGTAGSGKTTLAIHRAAYLAKRTKTKQKVLLVTFNKSLVTYLNSISDSNLYKVDVRNYHWFARGYLEYKGMLGWNVIVPSMDFNKENKKLTFVKMAIDEIIKEIGNNATLSRAPEVFYEEICWIQKMGINTIDEYNDAERIGRSGTRINRDKRKYFFDVYKRYLEIREKNSYKYDWDDIAQTVRDELINDEEERMYKHIIIDEGQDLSPVMLQSLALAIPKDGSVTFFGDVAQQIYGGRISWRNAGLQVTRNEIWKFDQNYRNSKEIADLAIAISKQPFFNQSTDLVTPQQPKASGPKPVLINFSDEEKELNWVINSVPALAKTETVAILVRTRALVKKIRGMLTKNGTSYQELDRDLTTWDSSPGISIGTYHSAKGLEFDTVMVPFCNSVRIPDEDKIAALEDRNEALSEDVKLIYVAVTRAKRRLVLSYAGEITEVIPTSDALYTKREYV
jgi:superfamily I DNA/RNA helicase